MWTSTFTLLSSALLLALTCHAKAGETGEERNLTLVGSPCNPNNTRLLVDNNQLQSECGYLAWCDAGDLTCKVRGCRRDEWPFGFNKKARDLWPPKCGYEEFCPDEGSLCMVKVGLGEPCQLSRDDQCKQSVSPLGVRCLHNRCVAVDATLEKNCTYENTIYTNFINVDNNYGEIISRDNCVSGLFCDSPTTKCKRKVAKGTACSADKECQTEYCTDKSYVYSIPVNNNVTGTCSEALSASPSKPYVYVLTIITLCLLTGFSGVFLIKVHQRQTKAKKEERESYWQGQRLISEKAKLIDGSVRSTTPMLSSSSKSTPTSPSGKKGRGSRSFSNNDSINSVSPSYHPDSRLSVHQRLSDGSFGGQAVRHPLQQNTHYLSVHQQEGNSVDYEVNRAASSTENIFLSPSQSTQSLHEAYKGAGAAKTSGSAADSGSVDPFNPLGPLHSDDRGMRNREAGRDVRDGWRSPDGHRADKGWTY